ncbi:MAG TPA: NUDIX domain-containing protein [Candidatus Saccharimonadales bacterium]|nr:NUDIX domain-containing protein [Candidatus Saccharimonadales bacterium]
MPKISAGLLVYRFTHGSLKMLLIHPGGPFWVKKDLATWSVPKGLADEGEELFTAATREFTEETGITPPVNNPIDLGFVKYGNKKVFVWAVEGDVDVRRIQSATIQLEWPPRSGQMREFPECDKAGWFTPDAARRKLVKGQVPLVDRLIERVR